MAPETAASPFVIFSPSFCLRYIEMPIHAPIMFSMQKQQLSTLNSGIAERIPPMTPPMIAVLANRP
jgi:hypothetical protein